jgi:hypothetical protein
MRFAFIDAWRHQWRVTTLCRVMRVSERGYRAWRSRPISQRARTDMAVLAHIREQYSLSLGSAVYPERLPCRQSKGSPEDNDGAEGGRC